MNLVRILFTLLFSVSLVCASSLSKKERKAINDSLTVWEKTIAANPDGVMEYHTLVENVAVITNKLKPISANESLAKRLYPLALRAINDLIIYYELKSFHSRNVHELATDVYNFALIFKDHLSEAECLEFFLKSANCMIRNGTDWSFLNIYVEPKDDENLRSIINFLGRFLASNDKMEGKESLVGFFLYYAESAKDRNMLDELITSRHALNCLLFINNYKIFPETNFIVWTVIFFKSLHKIFKDNMPDLKVFLDLAKLVKYEQDIDWVIGIFSYTSISQYIYDEPALLASALDNLIRIKTQYPERFESCIKDLGSSHSTTLLEKIEQRSLKKEQIATNIKIRKLLPRLTISKNSSYVDYKAGLIEIHKSNLDILSKADKEFFGEHFNCEFLSIYMDYLEQPDKYTIALLLNEFISIQLRLGVFYKEIHEIAKVVTEKVVEYHEKLFLEKDEDIALFEIPSFISSFHGEILSFEERVPLLCRLMKNWKMNVVAVNIVIQLLETLNWFHEQIFATNIRQRVIRFFQSKSKTSDEREDITALLHYSVNELQIFSKSEALALKMLLKNVNK